MSLSERCVVAMICSLIVFPRFFGPFIFYTLLLLQSLLYFRSGSSSLAIDCLAFPTRAGVRII